MSSFSYKQGFRDGFMILPFQVYQLPAMKKILARLPSYSEALPIFSIYRRGFMKGVDAAYRLWGKIERSMKCQTLS